MDINAKKGTKVKVVNFDEKIMNWGGNDNPADYLKIGNVYTVLKTEIHSWHTKVYLKEFPDLKFGSAHFE